MGDQEAMKASIGQTAAQLPDAAEVVHWERITGLRDQGSGNRRSIVVCAYSRWMLVMSFLKPVGSLSGVSGTSVVLAKKTDRLNPAIAATAARLRSVH
jgi:hypothetical protein